MRKLLLEWAGTALGVLSDVILLIVLWAALSALLFTLFPEVGCLTVASLDFGRCPWPGGEE